MQREQQLTKSKPRGRQISAALAATVALVAGLVVMDGRPGNAAGLEVSNVSAALTTPATATGPFTATGRVVNSGTLPQVAGSKVTISTISATISALPSGCVANNGDAVCTAGTLAPGQSQSFNVTVSPTANATGVTTTAKTVAGQPDLNAPITNPNDDNVTNTTQVLYSLQAGLASHPSEVARGADTLLSATVTNAGAAQSAVTLSLATGGAVDPAVALPAGCAADAGNASVTCSNIAMAAGATKQFDVAAVTPATGSTMTSTATVTGVNGSSSSATTTTSIDSLQAGISSRPAEVRQGSDTLLSATVTNNGIPQSGVTLTIATGGVVDSALALPAGCVADSGNTSVTCSNISVFTGETKQFDVAATTPATGSSITSTATVTGANGSGNSASTTTTLSANAQAFVPQGHALTFDNVTQSGTFQVPQGSAPGIFLTLDEADITGTLCGATPCAPKAAEALFPSSGTYQATDPNHPLIWSLGYKAKQSCNGRGFPSGCLPLYWIGSGQSTAQQIAPCPTYATNRANPARMTDPNVPCINFVTKTTQGLVTYEVALLKDIVIPIVSGATSVK